MSAPAKLERIQGLTGDLQKVQDNVGRAMDPLSTSPLAGALLIENVLLKYGYSIAVPHALGCPARGCIVVKASAQADIWNDTPPPGLESKVLQLRTSADVTVSLLVF